MIFKILFMSMIAFSAERDCSKPSGFKEFYECSLAKNPQYSVSSLKAKEGEAAYDKAAQWENPELQYKNVSGDNAGTKVESTEISLAVPISQVWVNGAKRDVGLAEKEIAHLESKQILLDAKKQVLTDLFRLRQVDEELELVQEALSAFNKIKSQFKSRLVRGAEQEIVLNLVELATGDYGLKENHLSREKLEILSRVKAIWGPQFVIKNDLLPPFKTKWPDVNGNENAVSFETQKLIAQSSQAAAESKLQSRESWPTLKLGPTLEKNVDGSTQYSSVGFNAALSLPLFSWNGGGREVARLKQEQASLASDFAKKKSVYDRDILLQKYRASVESLRKTSTRDALRTKHGNIDSLFRQGLTGGSIVIEAHRQITEFTLSQHENEIEALTTFLELKSYLGEDIGELFK